MNQSHALYQQAQQYLPGGVNSPVRAFGGVGGEPVFFQRAEGAYLWDVDGQRYIDYVGSWGPMIAGHSHPHVIDAITQAAKNGLSFGAPCEAEVQLAQRLCKTVSSMDMVRMVNSGTEATTTAIRLARGFTGRSKIIKFIGCYHGHCDALLVKAGSGALTHQQPDSAGIPESVIADTILVDYNDSQAVEDVFAHQGDDIAAVIVEPVAGNMGLVLPELAFLTTLRQCCHVFGALLIFDEVMTGFRVALGGAQAHYGIKPDLTTLGKVIGGGCPVGAVGGRRDIMKYLSPLGPVYQAGTLSGNPLAMASGLATLDLIEKPGFYEELNRKTTALAQGLKQKAAQHGIPLAVQSIGGMLGFFFSELDSIQRLSDVQQSNRGHFQAFFHGMLSRGVYLAPSSFEAGFVSQAHTDEDIAQTLMWAEEVMSELKCPT